MSNRLLSAMLTQILSRPQEQAAWALNAMTAKNDACIEELHELDAPSRLLPLLSFPETWNWTPLVSTMQNVSGGPQRAKQALVSADAVTVFVDLLGFGRPTLQVLHLAHCMHLSALLTTCALHQANLCCA